MQITVAGKQVETGEALKVHVEEGLGAVTRKYFDRALEAHVTFSKDRAFFVCDIHLHAGRGLTLRGEGEGADAHRAFDIAAEHLAKRLRRYRRRVNEHARSMAEEREAPPVERARVSMLRVEDEEEEEVRPDAEAVHGAIVAETPAEIARLSVREAAMRLDLADVPVLMFRNRASGQLNVVYRRRDGNLGWIDPAV
jgi:ribosomal subunit interface protein